MKHTPLIKHLIYPKKEDIQHLQLYALCAGFGLITLSYLARMVDPAKVPDIGARWGVGLGMVAVAFLSMAPGLKESRSKALLTGAAFFFGWYASWIAYRLHWEQMGVITLIAVLNGGMLSLPGRKELIRYCATTLGFLGILTFLPSPAQLALRLFVLICVSILIGFAFILIFRRQQLLDKLVQEENSNAQGKNLMAAVLESSRSIIWSCDACHRLLTFNEAFKRFFHLHFQEAPMPGQIFRLDLLFENEKERIATSLCELQEGRHVAVELVFNTGRTSSSWYLFVGNPIHSNDNSHGYAVYLSDITDAKVKNQRLTRLQHAMEHTHEAVALVDKHGRFSFANHAFTHLTGLGEGDGFEGLGKLVQNPSLPEVVFSRLLTGSNWEGEFALESHAIQNKIIVKAKLDGLYNLAGRLNGAVMFISDITDIRQAQALNRGILETSPDGIMAFRSVRNQQGRIIDFEWTLINPAGEQIVGRTKQELLGKRLLTEMPGNLSEGLFERYVNVVESGAPASFEHFYNHEQVCNMWFRTSAVKVEDGFAVTFTNITEQKKSETELQKLSLVAEKTIAGVIISDAKGKIEWVNEAFTRISGYKLEEVKGKSPGSFLQGKDTDPAAIQAMRETLHSGSAFTGEILNYHKCGQPYWLSLNINPIVNQQGQIEQFIAIENDITAAKQAEAELKRAMQDAEEATRAKSDFLATMSHEIRTPMNAVIGLTSLMLETQLTPEQRDYLQTIRSSGDNLLVIINDILDYSKIESGKLALEQKRFNLHDMVEDCLDLIAPRTHQHTIELSAHFSPTAPEWILGDPTRLRQVLVNLLSNAVKFTPKGEVSVWVTALSAEQTDLRRIQVEVRDTGVGIAENKQRMLFQPFSQADASVTRKFGGTGLGLAISSKLTRLMGGDIWLSSTPGVGSSFFFTLLSPATEPAPLALNPLEGLSALVMCKSELLQQMVERLCRYLGLQVAASPEESDLASVDFFILDHELREPDAAREWPVFPEKTLWLEAFSSLKHPPHAGGGARLAKPVRRNVLRQALIKLAGMQQPVDDMDSSAAHLQVTKRKNLAVLVVEDNLVNQKVATRMLQKLGLAPDLASNGGEAIEAMMAKNYDLVWMDIQMPEMDGLTATRILRERGFHQPIIIAMTANALQGDREACLEAGMNDYISKPIKLEELQRTIDTWFEPVALANEIRGV